MCGPLCWQCQSCALRSAPVAQPLTCHTPRLRAAEIIKRRIAGLHQVTKITSIDITDVWEPTEEGLDRIETTRHVSVMTIVLSKVLGWAVWPWVSLAPVAGRRVLSKRCLAAGKRLQCAWN